MLEYKIYTSKTHKTGLSHKQNKGSQTMDESW